MVEHNDPPSGSETNQSLLSDNIVLVVVVVTVVEIIYISIPPYSSEAATVSDYKTLSNSVSSLRN